MSLLSTSSATGDSVTNLSVARPAGAGAAHYLIAGIHRIGVAGGFLSGAAGWTIVQQLQSPDFTSQLQLWIALGDVATLNWTVPSGSSGIRIGCAAFAGRSGGQSDSDITSGTGASIAVPSMDAISGDDAFAIWTDSQDAAGFGAAPAGFTDFFTNAGAQPDSTWCATAVNLSPGATGALSRTAVNFTAKMAAGVLLTVTGGSPAVRMGTRIFING